MTTSSPLLYTHFQGKLRIYKAVEESFVQGILSGLTESQLTNQQQLLMLGRFHTQRRLTAK
jgi:hypothetical protein